MWEAGRNPSDVFKGLVMRIVTLLRSGGDFIQHYLYDLVNGIIKHNPDAEIYCLTDMNIEHENIKPIYMENLPPKWWGKLLYKVRFLRVFLPRFRREHQIFPSN